MYKKKCPSLAQGVQIDKQDSNHTTMMMKRHNEETWARKLSETQQIQSEEIDCWINFVLSIYSILESIVNNKHKVWEQRRKIPTRPMTSWSNAEEVIIWEVIVRILVHNGSTRRREVAADTRHGIRDDLQSWNELNYSCCLGWVIHWPNAAAEQVQTKQMLLAGKVESVE